MEWNLQAVNQAIADLSKNQLLYGYVTKTQRVKSNFKMSVIITVAISVISYRIDKTNIKCCDTKAIKICIILLFCTSIHLNIYFPIRY